MSDLIKQVDAFLASGGEPRIVRDSRNAKTYQELVEDVEWALGMDTRALIAKWSFLLEQTNDPPAPRRDV